MVGSAIPNRRHSKPNCCLALVQVLIIWVFHLRSHEIVTPRKQVDSTTGMTLWQTRILTTRGTRLRENTITFDFWAFKVQHPSPLSTSACRDSTSECVAIGLYRTMSSAYNIRVESRDREMLVRGFK